jgi:hypothetical protein
VEKELLELLAPTLFKRIIILFKRTTPTRIRTRTSHRPEPNKTKQTTMFKKKKKGVCFVCESPDHFASQCPNCKAKKSDNMVVSEAGGTSGYSNLLSSILFTRVVG